MLKRKTTSTCIFFLASMLVTFVLTTHSINAQSYPFKTFPLPRDLPNIERMYEDHLGYIWLGTAEGLYRFDGTNYTLYTSSDVLAGLGREVIKCMYEDKELHFWVGAKSGLYRYDPKRKDFDKFSFSDDMYPLHIYQESDTAFLVLCRNRIFHFNPERNSWIPIDVLEPDGEIYTMQIGKNNDLWIGTDLKVRQYNLSSKAFHDFPLPVPVYAKSDEKISVSNMFLDSRDRLWINTWYKGVVILDTHTGKTELIDTVETAGRNRLLEEYVPSFAEDEEGNIWMANINKGINIHHQKTGMISYLLKDTDFNHGLKGNDFILMTDREKNMWVKSNLALHFLNRQNPIPTLVSDSKAFVEDALFIKFVQPDFLLEGTYFGMFGINTLTHKVTSFNTALELPATHNAEFQATPDAWMDGEKVWVSSPQGLRLLSRDKNKKGDPGFSFEKLYPIKAPFWPTRLFPFNDSLLFVKGRINTNAFATFNTRSGEFQYYTFPDSLVINYSMPFHYDTVLIAIRNKGLYYYTLRDQVLSSIPWKFAEHKVVVTSPVFYKMVALQDGSYALCSENYGLILFDPKTKSFRLVDVASVANTNRVFSVEEDDHANLWIQTFSELLYYDRGKGSISKINLSNSFGGDLPYFFMNSGGMLYGTFEGGLYQVDPQQLFFKTEKPRLYLETIKARDKALSWTPTGRLRLNFSDNFLTYDFRGLDYDNPQGITYWYKIPGISDHWQFLGNQSSVSFGRMQPGKYQFVIKAANDAGIWSDEVSAPEIIIRPPFWKTWWFVLGIIALMASVTAYLIWQRRTKYQAELRLRNQIARDLHDDIGSTLSGIKIFSVIASGMSEENKELSSLLQQIRDKSDMMMQSMSDIVWSINPAHDSLHDLMIRLKQYMSEMLESQEVDVHYSVPTDLKSMKIDLSHRKELYLALKEIINNTAKYASCKNFYFDIRKQKGDVIFQIQDDGIGMDDAEITYGNGLKNIESRMNQIGATVSRESAPGHGVKYVIRLHLL